MQSNSPSLHHSNTPSSEVAAGLLFRAGKLLITQRRDQGHLANLWEFPGGKLEAGETFEQCLGRELREELGIDVAVGELAEELTHHYSERSVHLKFFRCTLVEHEPQPIGCQAVVWVTADQLARYPFPAADERVLAKLRANAQWWRDTRSDGVVE